MRRIARGRQPVPGVMNKLEAAYSLQLRARQIAGEVLWFKYEAVKLRLAEKTFYTPDFAVMLDNGELEMHECKGWMEEDANVKIKVAASMYPFRFIRCMHRNKAEGWTFYEYGAA